MIGGIIVALIYAGFVAAFAIGLLAPYLEAHLTKTAAGIVGLAIVIVLLSPVIFIRRFIQKY